jgi:hypothetical protein
VSEGARASGWCVDWSAYDLNAIWEMVAPEGDAATEDQVHAWRRMADLCNHHAERLANATEVLAQRWPPERSAAANVFIEYAKGLIGSMREAASAAAANAAEMDRFTGHLADTRDRVLELKQQQAIHVQAEADRAAYLHKLATARGLIPPSALANAPHVPTDWRGDLNAQAQHLMQLSDPVIAGTNARLVVPPPFDPRVKIETWELFNPDDGSPAAGAATGASGYSASTGLPQPIYNPPPPTFGQGAGEPGIRMSTSPILDGASPAQLPSVPTPRTLQTVPGGSGPVTPGPTVVAGPGADSLGLMPGAIAVPPAATAYRPGAHTAAAVGEPAAHGATARAGAVGGMGVAPMAPIARGTSSGQRINPAGGIISGGRRRDPHDPDDPWVVPEAGSAILAPGPEPTHEPGPGVIGIDR